jgi:hypothetical protein
MDVQRYVAELQSLRAVLLAAQAESEAQAAKMAEVRRKEKEKLPSLELFISLSDETNTLTLVSFFFIQLETANSKLVYQAKHLKRSLQEADEKLKAAGL